MAISKCEKKKLCSGCRNNRYNMGAGFCERPGVDAVVTSDECWHLESATVVKRKMVSISQTPPWMQSPIKTLSCKSVDGYVFIDAKRVR